MSTIASPLNNIAAKQPTHGPIYGSTYTSTYVSSDASTYAPAQTSSQVPSQVPSMAQRLFTEHPAAVEETYLQHLRAASSFAGGLAVCTFCCFVHAVVPGFFTTSASARVERMHERMHSRNPHG